MESQGQLRFEGRDSNLAPETGELYYTSLGAFVLDFSNQGRASVTDVTRDTFQAVRKSLRNDGHVLR
jgi:hypothetical protein